MVELLSAIEKQLQTKKKKRKETLPLHKIFSPTPLFRHLIKPSTFNKTRRAPMRETSRVKNTKSKKPTHNNHLTQERSQHPRSAKEFKAPPPPFLTPLNSKRTPDQEKVLLYKTPFIPFLPAEFSFVVPAELLKCVLSREENHHLESKLFNHDILCSLFYYSIISTQLSHIPANVFSKPSLYRPYASYPSNPKLKQRYQQKSSLSTPSSKFPTKHQIPRTPPHINRLLKGTNNPVL